MAKLNWERAKTQKRAVDKDLTPASDKQKLFIKSLLETKDHELGEMYVEGLSMTSAKDLIRILLSKPTRSDVVFKPTDKQLSFANALVEQKGNGAYHLNQLLRKKNVGSLSMLSKEDVSEFINLLIKCADKPKPVKIDEVGAYLLDERVFSIRKGMHTKRLQVYAYDEHTKTYHRVPIKLEQDVLSRVEPSNRLTLAQAEKYSAHTGKCCHCGRDLTQLKSVAMGMGAVCAKKYH